MDYYHPRFAGNIANTGVDALLHSVINDMRLSRATKIAARHGHLCTIKWISARAKAIELDLLDCADEGRQLEALKWAHTVTPCTQWRRYSRRGSHIWNHLAKKGQLDVIKWLHANGALMPHDLHIMCDYAAEGGHLNVLKWMREAGVQWVSNICATAAAHGHVSMLAWLCANGAECTSGASLAAARHGHKAVLEWLRDNGHPWGDGVCHNAALNGHAALVKWLHANGALLSSRVCTYAADSGSMALLVWLRARGVRMNTDACTHAAKRGQLGVLQWLLGNGVPLRPATIEAAAKYGQTEVLSWLIRDTCTLKWVGHDASEIARLVLQTAKDHGTLEVLKWLKEMGESPHFYAYFNAAKTGDLLLLKWLHGIGMIIEPFQFSDILHAAALGNHLSIVQWVYDRTAHDFCGAQIDVFTGVVIHARPGKRPWTITTGGSCTTLGPPCTGISCTTSRAICG